MAVSYMHSFDVAEAKRFGIEKAVILNTLRLWIIKNRADRDREKYFIDGRWWAGCTSAGWVNSLPYMNYRQIKRHLDALVADGILVCENQNRNQWNRYFWYAFVDEDKYLPEDDDARSDAEIEDAPEVKSEPVKVAAPSVTDEIAHTQNLVGVEEPALELKPENNVTDEIMHRQIIAHAYTKFGACIDQNLSMNNKDIIYVSLYKEKEIKKEKENINDELVGVLCRAFDKRTASDFFENVTAIQYEDYVAITSEDAAPLQRLQTALRGRYESHNKRPIIYVVFTHDREARSA